ncbi:MAG: sensor histidine kinase [Caldilineaceae bacterium]|jgi:two-component system sensor histidine kinase BaeS
MNIRSLAVKLTIAFLAVGVIGVLLASLIISVSTQRAFDQFLFGRTRPATEAALRAYYEEHGGWGDLNQAFESGPNGNGRGQGQGPPLATVADANGVVVFGGGGPGRIGTRVSADVLRDSVPINVDGKVVGYLLFDYFGDRRQPNAPERIFLRDLNRSILWASAGAAVVALILGALLASTLTKPIRLLTAATKRISQGELGVQVPVHTKDELGELTASFNSMSADLEEASRLRRQMTADIAHDLRTPLSVILGYTEALSDGKLQATPEIADTLHRESKHLNHLVDDLRTLSLADAGELPLHRSLLSPATLLQRAETSYAMQAERQEITLSVNAAASLPMINVDSQRMAQVLGNLVSNALRHTPGGGAVSLSAQAGAGTVELRVQDTGSGIEPEVLPHVFDRFYRGDRARSQDGESGLGLSIAKSIVEAHDGTIQIASEPGKGTVFTIQLPAVPNP